MAVELAPWAVDGAKHSGAVARTLAYASTSGAEGIIGTTDLEVLATQTPSNQVRVMPGALAIRNRDDRGGQQTYTARNVSQTLVTVQPTGSAGGRTDWVWAHVVDPEYTGQIPENPLTAQYFFLTAGAEQPPGNGWYRLARIDIPANTQTITQAMITDLREVANPREKRVRFPRPVVNGHISGYSHVLRHRRDGTGDGRGEQFPDAANGGRFDLEIPDWAVRMHVDAEWTSLRYNGQSSWGAHYLQYVGQDGVWRSTQDFGWDTAEGAVQTQNWTMHDNLFIPWALRGGPVSFYMRAFVDTATSAQTGAVSLTGRSGLHLEVTFYEVAEWTGVNV